jgi:hypothetical protein
MAAALSEVPDLSDRRRALQLCPAQRYTRARAGLGICGAWLAARAGGALGDPDEHHGGDDRDDEAQDV